MQSLQLKKRWPDRQVVIMKNEQAFFNSINDGMNADWNSEDLQKHVKKWFLLVDQYALFFAHCEKDHVPPSEQKMLSSNSWKEMCKKWRINEDDVFKCEMGRSCIGDPKEKTDVLFRVVFEACKFVNSIRVCGIDLQDKDLPTFCQLKTMEKFELLDCV
jgi:hypothetical protein